jgi:two-component system, NarL family, response regulator NreC
LPETVIAQITILIVDDHAAVRGSIRSMMESRSEWRVCGEATDGLDAIEKAATLRPDLVLMDLSMPRLDGIEATRIIRREIPTTQVLVISQNDAAISSCLAIEAGAWGYLSKDTLGSDLIPAIDRFSRGECYGTELHSRKPAF